MCAPAGTGLRDAVKRLVGVAAPPVHADVDEILCQSRATEESLEKAGRARPPAGSKPPSMYDLTWTLPRFKVAELWKDAASDALRTLRGAATTTKILSCHLVYYCGRRTEFDSPVSENVLTNYDLEPRRVIVLIDDVFDMFLRLNGDQQLFDTSYQMESLSGRTREEENVGIEEFSPPELARIVMEWQVGVMTQLLHWRELEILTAERLAFDFDAEFLVFGVKQFRETAARWIAGNTRSVYLSHPIARPRRIFLSSRKWPDVVEQFNGLQEAFLGEGLACVMPTAIDEYRIERKRPARNVARPSFRRPRLTARWPLPVATDRTLYVPPGQAADFHHRGLLSPKRWDFDEQRFRGTHPSNVWYKLVDPLLSSFEHRIEWQVSSRDHLLVSWCDDILVFRPFFREGAWSDGVRAEIVHWMLHAREDQNRRMGLVHFQEDIDAMLAYINKRSELAAEMSAGVSNEVDRIISEDTGLAEDLAAKVVNFIEQGKPAGMLDQATVTPDAVQSIESNLAEFWETARANWLRRKLSGIDLGHEPTESFEARIGVWVVENAAGLEQVVKQAAAFFVSGRKTGDETIQHLRWVREG